MSRQEYRGTAATLTLINDLGAADVSFSVTGDGSGWPTGAAGRQFVVVVDRNQFDGVNPKEEKILCASLTSGTIAVVQRGHDGGTARVHNAGATVQHMGPSATKLDDLDGHVYDTTRDDHAQYSLVDGTRAFTGLNAIAGTPVAIGGSASLSGSAVTLARSDHVHAITAGGISDAAMFAAQVVSTNALASQAVTADKIGDGTASSRQVSVNNGQNTGALTSATYIDFGGTATVTVPAWATKAIIRTDIGGMSGAGGGGTFRFKTVLNGVDGGLRWVGSDGTETFALGLHYVDQFSGLATGSVIVKTQAERATGAGSLTFGGTTGSVDFDIEWRP